MKVDFDMALLVIASGLYRRLAQRMRGYAECQAWQILHGFIHMPADVNITEREVHVRFRRRAHLPIIAASGPPDEPVTVPWWNGMSLRMQALLPNDAATVLGKFFGVEIWASTKIDYCNPGGIRMLP